MKSRSPNKKCLQPSLRQAIFRANGDALMNGTISRPVRAGKFTCSRRLTNGHFTAARWATIIPSPGAGALAKDVSGTQRLATRKRATPNRNLCHTSSAAFKSPPLSKTPNSLRIHGPNRPSNDQRLSRKYAVRIGEHTRPRVFRPAPRRSESLRNSVTKW